MTSATAHATNSTPTPRTPRIGLVVTRPDGHVWTWRPDADLPSLTCVYVKPATAEQADRPVQVARIIAGTVYGLDTFQPRIRGIVSPPDDPPHATWSYLYALPCAPGEEPEGHVADGWWNSPAELLTTAAQHLSPNASAALRALLPDGARR